MTYLPDLHAYLNQSSLLIQAYPQSTRITTKYSLPKKSKTEKKADETQPAEGPDGTHKQKREPSATLTLKTFHPDSGICLKYQTDKAAEVGRLVTGLGRLAKGEIIDMPTTNSAENDAGAGVEIGRGPGWSGTDQIEVDDTGATGAKTATQMTQQNQQQQGGGTKKKKGKK